MANLLKKYTKNTDIWSAVRRLGSQMAKELTDEEVFTSSAFYNYAVALTKTILTKHRRLHALSVFYNPKDTTTAYTDGKRIVMNAANRLVSYPKLLETRFKVLFGILFHEIAHILFLDFEMHQKGMNELLEGRLFGNFDVPAGSPLEANLQELKQAQADGYEKAIASVYKEVLNIVNDGHDESAMKQCFKRFIAQCIIAAGLVQQELSASLEKNVADGASELSIFYSLMLQFAKYGYCKLGEENANTKPYTDLFSEMEPVIEAAVAEDDYSKRWDHINILILQLWPVVKKVIDQLNNNSSGGGGSGNGGGASGEELEQILEELANAANANNSAAPAPSGSGKAVSVAAVAGQGDPGSEEALGPMLSQLGNEKAQEAVQKELDKAQKEFISSTNKPVIHDGVPVKLKRHHPQDKEAYDAIYDEIKPYVSNLVSGVKALLREYNEEALLRHRRYGPIIEASESYRPDGAFFAKKKLPEDRPNMAVSVLIDQSGSMSGAKLAAAIVMAILLERFASDLDIPIMIAGHSTSDPGVKLNIFTDFVSAQPEKDRYSLAAIRSLDCNRDGLPLRLCAEMLAQRPEEIRMMVVISDGKPNDGSYRGASAFMDIKQTVAEYKRKGLIIYGAAIDQDRKIIQELYGKGFLSITDLQALPKTMVRLLKQNIV